MNWTVELVQQIIKFDNLGVQSMIGTFLSKCHHPCPSLDVRLEKRGRSAVTHPILHFQTTPSAFDGLSVSIRIGGVHEIFTMVHSQMSEVAPRYVGNVTISAPFVRDDYRTGCDVVPYP